MNLDYNRLLEAAIVSIPGMLAAYFTYHTRKDVHAVKVATNGMKAQLEAQARVEGKIEGKAEGVAQEKAKNDRP